MSCGTTLPADRFRCKLQTLRKLCQTFGGAPKLANGCQFLVLSTNLHPLLPIQLPCAELSLPRSYLASRRGPYQAIANTP
jgi:hypothetical protein